MNMHDSSSQLERYLSFLQQDPKNHTLLLDISRSYLEQDELEQAQSYLDQAKKINPPACLALQGFIYVKHAQLAQARASFQEALRYEDTAEIRYYLGFILFLEQDLHAALEMLSTVDTSDYSEFACILKARILHQQGELVQAITLLEEHLQEYPNNAEAMGLLALIYFDTNEEQLAAQLSEKALALNPDLYEPQIVELMLRVAERQATSEEIQQLLKLYPQDSRLLFALGSVFMMEGSLEEAITYYQQTLELQPEFYDGHLALAWCYLLTDALHEAHEIYQNAVELSDHFADAWAGLAIIQAFNEDWEQTQLLIDKAQSLDAECFLIQIAKIMLLNHTDPNQAQSDLFKIVHDEHLPVSQKLALIINELEQDFK